MQLFFIHENFRDVILSFAIFMIYIFSFSSLIYLKKKNNLTSLFKESNLADAFLLTSTNRVLFLCLQGTVLDNSISYSFLF